MPARPGVTRSIYFAMLPQRSQMQARPRCVGGTRSRAAASIVCAWHQHGVAKLPDSAGAQPFGPPHSGQSQAGTGTLLVAMVVVAGIAYCTQEGAAAAVPRKRWRMAAFAGIETYRATSAATNAVAARKSASHGNRAGQHGGDGDDEIVR